MQQQEIENTNKAEESIEFEVETTIEIGIQDPESGTETSITASSSSFSSFLLIVIILIVLYHFLPEHTKNKIRSDIDSFFHPQISITNSICRFEEDIYTKLLSNLEKINWQNKSLYGGAQNFHLNSLKKISNQITIKNVASDGNIYVTLYVDDKKQIHEVNINNGEEKTIQSSFYVNTTPYESHQCRVEIQPKKLSFWLFIKSISIRTTIVVSKKVRR